MWFQDYIFFWVTNSMDTSEYMWNPDNYAKEMSLTDVLASLMGLFHYYYYYYYYSPDS